MKRSSRHRRRRSAAVFLSPHNRHSCCCCCSCTPALLVLLVVDVVGVVIAGRRRPLPTRLSLHAKAGIDIFSLPRHCLAVSPKGRTPRRRWRRGGEALRHLHHRERRRKRIQCVAPLVWDDGYRCYLPRHVYSYYYCFYRWHRMFFPRSHPRTFPLVNEFLPFVLASTPLFPPPSSPPYPLARRKLVVVVRVLLLHDPLVDQYSSSVVVD